MKPLKLTWDTTMNMYRVNQPGDQSGEYVSLQTANELKQALQDTLWLLTELVPIGTFKNYNEVNGADEGVAHATDLIGDALRILSESMTEQEKINSPLDLENV